MIHTFIFGILVIYTFSIFISFAGTFLVSPISKKYSFEKKIELLLGYFTGLALFITLWRLGDLMFQSSRIGVVFAAVPILLLAITQFKHYFKFIKSHRLLIALLVVLALTIQVLVTTFWARDIYTDVYSTLGSGHSPRYGNISIHGIEMDRVPIYGINYLQSLLSMLPMILGGKSPLVYLSIWLGFSLFVIIVLSYLILRRTSLPPFYAIGGVILVCFGNTAFSTKQYLVMDTGSPFFLAGYSDTIHSIGVLLSIIAFLCATTFSKKSDYSRVDKIKLFIGLGTLFFLNTILAPQNIIGTAVALGLIFLSIFFLKKSNNKLVFFLQLIVFSLSILAGTFSGGFLTPIKNQDPVDLPSINRLQVSQFTPSISPSLPYHLGSYHNWQMPKNDDLLINFNGSHLDRFLVFLDLFSESLHVLFFPILGLILVFCYRSKSAEIKTLFILASIALFVGFMLVWPIKIYGSKWAQTRFFIPGIYFSQLCFCIGIYFSTRKIRQNLQKFIFMVLTVFICFGPTKNFLEIVNENFSNLAEFQKRIDSISNYSQIPKTN